MRRLTHVWRNFHVEQVFRADAPGVMASGLRWFSAMLLGGLRKRNPHALLDRAPLRRLLNQTLACAKIQQSIDAGALHALGITASGYSSGQSVTFYQGVSTLSPWMPATRLRL